MCNAGASRGSEEGDCHGRGGAVASSEDGAEAGVLPGFWVHEAVELLLRPGVENLQAWELATDWVEGLVQLSTAVLSPWTHHVPHHHEVRVEKDGEGRGRAREDADGQDEEQEQLGVRPVLPNSIASHGVRQRAEGLADPGRGCRMVLGQLPQAQGGSQKEWHHTENPNVLRPAWQYQCEAHERHHSNLVHEKLLDIVRLQVQTVLGEKF
mmetsp:Transcript_7105/g.10203  ORF Transcript_7105/g.10203 Transcript_7105/m.10203 type:complete len:210 (+) Transcript_7105:28-657(+)